MLKLFFLLSFLFIGGWELFWRIKGFVPSVTDDLGAWARIRRSAALQGTEPVVVVGSSRIQVGFHPDVFEDMTGIRPIMLAIDGGSPVSVLKDLVFDPTFKGIIVCSLLPRAPLRQ